MQPILFLPHFDVIYDLLNDYDLLSTKVNGVFSDWLPVYCGVPQGSLLGPLLFNIFINDDDTAAYASNTDISALELSLNKDLKNLSSWFASNYLFVNSKKTQAMILGKHSHELYCK